MAKKSEARLGKGLAAIFGEDVNDVLEDIQQGKSDTHVSGRFEVSIDDVRPNPYQPRKTFVRGACGNWLIPSASMAYSRRSWSSVRWVVMS